MISAHGPSGTEGYAEEADALVRQYESIAFADAHRAILPLLPPAPADVLDIGAGTGRDAAGFSALGHHVTAVEPTEAMRSRAMALHPDPAITWIDDCLPDLPVLRAMGRGFDVIMLTAVWMHLDAAQRSRAMPQVARLLRGGGLMWLTLRHGPVPAGRRMFEVTAAETIALAAAEGIVCVRQSETGDGWLRRPDVRWDRLIFRRD
jgi:SAM-dependent methyltransferase